MAKNKKESKPTDKKTLSKEEPVVKLNDVATPIADGPVEVVNENPGPSGSPATNPVSEPITNDSVKEPAQSCEPLCSSLENKSDQEKIMDDKLKEDNQGEEEVAKPLVNDESKPHVEATSSPTPVPPAPSHNKSATSPPSTSSKPTKTFSCTVRPLDSRMADLLVSIPRDASGQFLFDKVCDELSILDEKDYFGLRYHDKHNQRQWLLLAKPALKQLKHMTNIVLNFRVKHYPAHPIENLKLKMSRYCMYLQLRRDFMHLRLLPETEDFEWLGTLALQEELASKSGDDVIAPENVPDFLHLNPCVPNQSKRREERILELLSRVRDLTAEEAEEEFLRRACRVDTYGVEPLPVQDQKNNSLHLGMNHVGVLVYQGSTRLHLYKWCDLLKIDCEGKKLEFLVMSEDPVNPSRKKKVSYTYKCDSIHAAQATWKWAVDRKCFFTLVAANNAKSLKAGGGLFHRAHRFQFKGKCQQELLSASASMNFADEPCVLRASIISPEKRGTLRCNRIGGRPYSSAILDGVPFDFAAKDAFVSVHESSSPQECPDISTEPVQCSTPKIGVKSESDVKEAVSPPVKENGGLGEEELQAIRRLRDAVRGEDSAESSDAERPVQEEKITAVKFNGKTNAAAVMTTNGKVACCSTSNFVSHDDVKETTHENSWQPLMMVVLCCLTMTVLLCVSWVIFGGPVQSNSSTGGAIMEEDLPPAPAFLRDLLPESMLDSVRTYSWVNTVREGVLLPLWRGFWRHWNPY